jgi:hypothetical protein
MPLLVILKRFEVWLLLGVVLGSFAFALRPDPARPAPADKGAMTAASPARTGESLPAFASEAPPETLTVEAVKVTQTDGGMIVELTLSGRSPTGEELTLDEVKVRATTGDGEPVNRFFEPFSPPPVLLASEDSVATLRWWLERPTDVLWLELNGERVKALIP